MKKTEDANLNEMLLLKRQKLDELKNEGKDPFVNETYDITARSKDIKEEFKEDEEREVSIAGRVMSKRRHGKICFLDVRDALGTIQVFARKDVLEDKYEEVKGLDIGDIVGVKGIVFKTEAGEITVRATDLTLLSKSLQILPEKFHGLKDPDLRYRQRYVDLIVNPEVKDVFVLRSKIISEIRKFLENRGFLEVETPILNTIAGGASARPFITHHNSLDIGMYLRIASELYLKRLIVGGFDKVYEIGRMFRNEGMDATHNPEFTTMELYQAYGDFEDMMEITETMVEEVANKVKGTTLVEFDGKEIELKTPWRRISMIDAVKEYSGVDFNEITEYEDAVKIAKEKNVEVKSTRGEIIAEFFDEFVEDKLIQPTFIIDYPVEISPLAKRKNDDESLT